MVIIARFSSVCPRCQTRITAGTRVEWTRGYPARHTNCTIYAAPGVRQPIQSSTGGTLPRIIATVGLDAPITQRLTVEDAGVYVLADGAIVRVKATQDKKRTYATVWTIIPGLRWTDADTRTHGEYKYLPDARDRADLMARVQATGRKMTLDEALAFAARHAQCARCERHLKDADSVMDGLGPKCIEYFGGKHGQTRKARGKNAAPVTDSARVAALKVESTTGAMRAAEREFSERRTYAEIFGDDDPVGEQWTADGQPYHPALATAADLPQVAAREARLAPFRHRSERILRSRWSRPGDDELEQAAF